MLLENNRKKRGKRKAPTLKDVLELTKKTEQEIVDLLTKTKPRTEPSIKTTSDSESNSSDFDSDVD